MNGIKTIFRKELSDHFSSYRFLILFGLITMVGLIMAYMSSISIHQEAMQGVVDETRMDKFIFLKLFTSSGIRFSLVEFVAFFGPLIGLIMGFDTINRERNEGTLSKLLSQPIFRDAVINGKFLAGVAMIALMMSSIILLISGQGLLTLGVVPHMEEIWRLFIYMIISIFYISFWLGISILFSIVFRSVATSALAALAVWIFFLFFVPLGADALSNSIAPGKDRDSMIQQVRIQKSLNLASPIALYSDATATIIHPRLRTTNTMLQMGMMEQLSMSRFSGPLSLDQSILVVMPYIVSLIALTVLCFAFSYSVFMRQEIRSL